MARLTDPILVPDNWPEHDAFFDALIHEQPKDPKELVGRLIRFPWADGYAWYRVEKIKPLTLAHLPINDAWQIHDSWIRGLQVTDVRRMVKQELARPVSAWKKP